MEEKYENTFQKSRLFSLHGLGLVEDISRNQDYFVKFIWSGRRTHKQGKKNINQRMLLSKKEMELEIEDHAV